MLIRTGRLVDLWRRPLGDALLEDTLTGTSVLAVEDAGEFDVGQRVLVGDDTTTYTVVNSDPVEDTIKVTPALMVDAEAGDPVAIMDGDVTIEIAVALVAPDDDDGEPITCEVTTSVLASVPEGPRDGDDGEVVRIIDQGDGSWLVFDVAADQARPTITIPFSCAGAASEGRGPAFPVRQSGRVITEIDVTADSGAGAVNFFIGLVLVASVPRGTREQVSVPLSKNDRLSVAAAPGGTLHDALVLITIS